MTEIVENGMVIGAEAAWDAKCEAEEYRREWIRNRAEEMIDDMYQKGCFEVAYNVDAVEELGIILSLHRKGDHVGAEERAYKVCKDYAYEVAEQQFDEADHDAHWMCDD